MPSFENFIGPGYSDATAEPGADDMINLYLETGGDHILRGTPGFSLFCTLPKSPIRGMLRGAANQLYAVAGDTYYEVFAAGTIPQYRARGTVTNDGLPVQMFSNEISVLIVSAENVYIDLGDVGGSPNFQTVYIQNGLGTVTTVGTAVTWRSGNQFDASNVVAGNTFTIAGVAYIVASVTDATHLVLTTSAGTQAGTTLTGTCSTAGQAVTWLTGNYFNPDPNVWAVPLPITINSVAYTIQTVASGTALTLVGFAGIQASETWSVTTGVGYSAAYPLTAQSAAFMDGYFIVSQPSGRQMNSSNLNNGLVWNPLNYATKEAYPGAIAQLFADHEQFWVFGWETTEVWTDTGLSAFPFQRNPSGFIHMGIVAQFSACHLAGSVAWLGGDPRGQPSAYMAAGFIPRRVSTHAVERAWAEYGTVADCVAYSYSDRGHDFWVLSFPTGNETWVYDATAGTWHKRLYWNGSAFGRHPVAWCAFVFGAYIGGDWNSGNLYTVSEDIATDAGTSITRTRSAPYTADPRTGDAGPDTEFVAMSKFEVDLSPLSSPPAVAKWDRSDNGGASYVPSPARAADTVATGQYLTRLTWRRLGKARRPGKGGDRIMRLTLVSTTADPVTIVNARIEAT